MLHAIGSARSGRAARLRAAVATVGAAVSAAISPASLAQSVGLNFSGSNSDLTTLVPADPFHGTTTPGVMIWVHDVIAPAMLVSLVVAVRRVWKGPTTGSGEGHSAAPLGSWRRWKGMT